MSALSKIAGILTVFIQLPIWYYLLYKVLEASHATELTWFLFWIYIPLGLFIGIVTKMVQRP